MNIKRLRDLSRWMARGALACALLYILTRLTLFKVLSWVALGASVVLVWGFWKCPHCGKYLGRSSGEYCPYCGQKLEK